MRSWRRATVPGAPVGGGGAGSHAADDGDEVFLAFARVFSGVLTARTVRWLLVCSPPPRVRCSRFSPRGGDGDGQELYVLHPKYDPTRDRATGAHMSRVTGPLSLFVMMGRGLIPVDAVCVAPAAVRWWWFRLFCARTGPLATLLLSEALETSC